MSSQYGIGVGGLAAGVASGSVSASKAALQVGMQASRIGMSAIAKHHQEKMMTHRDGMPGGSNVGGNMGGGPDLAGGAPETTGGSDLGLVLILGAGLLLARKKAV